MRHAFVWTDEVHSQRILCGSGAFARRFYERYDTYTGFRTFARGPQHALFPHLPPESPSRQTQSNPTTSRYHCDIYLRNLALGRQNPTRPRDPYLEGILLATRFTGKEDRSKDGTVDYMGQRVSGRVAER